MQHNYTNMMDKYRGVMVGLAVGDALGMPLEFLRKEEIRNRYGGLVTDYVAPKIGHLCEHLKPGQYTDDTQMTLALAKAILDKNEFNPHSFKNRLIEWYNCKDHRAPGNACIDSVYRLDQGYSYKESGQKDAAGCGSAMRVAPIGLVHDNSELVQHSYTQSIMTHKHKRATIGSIVTAYAVNQLVKQDESNFDRNNFLNHMIKLTESLETKLQDDEKSFSKKMKEIPNLFNVSYDEGIKKIGISGYVVETVNAALYSFLYSPFDFKTTVVNAVNQGDDADSIGAIAGAFSGALNGIRSIPQNWLDRLEGREEIVKISDDLLKLKLNKN